MVGSALEEDVSLFRGKELCGPTWPFDGPDSLLGARVAPIALQQAFSQDEVFMDVTDLGPNVGASFDMETTRLTVLVPP